MSNTSAPVTSTYGAIIKQLLDINAATRDKVRDTFTEMRETMPAHWYREYCTVWVQGCRQSGKTTGLLENIVKDSLVIVYNSTVIANLTDMLVKERRIRYKHLVESDNGIFKNFTVETVDSIQKKIDAMKRLAINITLDPDDDDPHATFDALLKEHKKKDAERAKERVSRKYSRFLVDEASYFFQHVDIKKFYRWAAAVAQEDAAFVFVG